MKSDADLLREFIRTRDEGCFAELVQRHIKFVYATCLRRMPHGDTAKDATQAVFVALARKAESVVSVPSLVGWLYRSACYQTRYTMRSERNRIARESEAHRLGTMLPEPRASLDEIAPILEDAMCELPDKDREAIIDRYFFEHSYASIGAKYRLTENAARMRVERGLQRLRCTLQKRGVVSSAATLAAALPSYASAQEPVGLVTAIAKASTLAVMSGGGVAFFGFMSMTKVIAGVVIASSVAGFFWERNRSEGTENQLSSTRAELSATTLRLQGVEEKIRNLQEAETKRVNAAASPSGHATTPVAAAPPMPGVTPEAPKGWHKNGSANELYDVGVDANNSWGGMPSAYVKSLGDAHDKFGGMMQTISAESFKGERVRLTGWMKTQEATDGANLWMRVDGQTRGTILQFDNMQGRAPKGTTDWQDYSVVLDVPQESSSLNYGFFLAGKGQAWVNGVTITKVGNDVPTTNLESTAKLPTAPVNLGFDPANTSK